MHVTAYKWRKSLLSAKGAEISAGRFHRAGGAPALYFAESPLTALLEVGALSATVDGGYHPYRRPPQILVSVSLAIPRGVLDLTEPGVLAKLGTTDMEISGNWITSRDPVTQTLGQIAYECGIVAIKFRSARPTDRLTHSNLVVFRDRLLNTSGCELKAHDPDRDLHSSVKPIVVP